MIFDSHAHYDDEAFDKDRDCLLSTLEEQGVGCIVNVGASFRGAKDSVELSMRYPHVYAAVGVHPDHVGELDEVKMQHLREMCTMEKTVAVGEIGLDYYWDQESHEVQKKWFLRQLEAAREAGLPVIIHSREAAADTLEMMKEYGQDLKGIIHCYSYSVEHAREYVKMGYLLGIGGVVTFKNARKLKEVVEEIPLEALVLETDCPYLAPVPNRGKRNSSLNLPLIAEEIAAIKQISCEEVITQTRENARKLFGV